MEGYPLDWLPGSPFLSPAWRWLRAGWLHDQNQATDHRIDDPWVERLLAFRANQEKAEPTDDKVLAQASAVFRAEQSPQRWELEARLLTAQPIRQVARACRLSPRTVEAYAAAFFDVRPRLAARDWVARVVIGPGIWQGFGGDQTPELWKLFAFLGGTAALDVLLAVTLDRPLPKWLTGSTPSDQARLRFLVKLTVAAYRARPLAELKSLIDIYEQAAREDRAAHGDRKALASDLRITRRTLELATAPRHPERLKPGKASRIAGTIPATKKAKPDRPIQVIQ